MNPIFRVMEHPSLRLPLQKMKELTRNPLSSHGVNLVQRHSKVNFRIFLNPSLFRPEVLAGQKS